MRQTTFRKGDFELYHFLRGLAFGNNCIGFQPALAVDHAKDFEEQLLLPMPAVGNQALVAINVPLDLVIIFPSGDLVDNDVGLYLEQQNALLYH